MTWVEVLKKHGLDKKTIEQIFGVKEEPSSEQVHRRDSYAYSAKENRRKGVSSGWRRGTGFDKRPLRWMKLGISLSELKNEVSYALKLLDDIPGKNIPNTEPDFKGLVSHIESGDVCSSLTGKLVDRVFDFNKMQHTSIKQATVRGGRHWLPYPLDSKEMNPLPPWTVDRYLKYNLQKKFTELTKKRPIDVRDYMKMFNRTHPRGMSKAMYADLWQSELLNIASTGVKHPFESSATSHQIYRDFHQVALKPFRTRLLLIYNFYNTCAGNYSRAEFEEWVKP